MPYKPEERLPLSDRQKRIYPQVEQQFTDEGYPILKLKPSQRNIFVDRVKTRRRSSRFTLIPREESMDEELDWPTVWSTAKTFTPSAVPLPIRQSYEEHRAKPSRGKYANTELLKVINFLHLTPVAIERHCKALKKFCTAWPEGLDTDEEVRSYFPVTVVTRDFVHSSPTIRNEKARIVDLKINIEDLKLNPIDKDKLIRLANHRYDKETGVLTITTSACPVRVQNKDYAEYLLTALYFESIKHEKWEDEKPECDWERFFWDKSESKKKIKDYLSGSSIDDEIIEKGQGNLEVEMYREALEKVFDKEDIESYEAYRVSVEKLFGLDQQRT